MLFGKKDDFAIEVAIDTEVSGRIYGNLFFWVNDKRLGNCKDDVQISIAVSQMRSLLDNKGSRLDAQLYGLNAENLFNTINSAIYEDHGQGDNQVEADAKYYMRFIAAPEIPAFDHLKAFLVDGPIYGRYVYQDRGIITEGKIGVGKFDAAIEDCINKLRGIYPRIISPA